MKRSIVNFDYDEEFDSLFIYCIDDYEYDVSLELDSEVILDLDINGSPVAFEFFNASKLFKVKKSDFSNLLRICIQSNITEKLIKIAVQLSFSVHNKPIIADVDRIATNLLNIPEHHCELASI